MSRLHDSLSSAVSHRLRVALLAIVSVGVLVVLTTAGSAASAGCTARSLYVVAHPDDSILFQAPDLFRDARAGDCEQTIFLTAGDAGYDPSYWQSREDGTMAAYAAMVNAPDSWTEGQVAANGHVIDSETLAADPNISVLFLNLPDGADDGSGFASDNFESLMKLWQGTITTMHPVDGSASYTKASLTSTLAALINQFKPTAIHTQDFIGNFTDADHTDHHAGAYLTRDAQRQYTAPHTLTSYVDSTIWQMPVNLSAADTQMKENIWFVYAPYDKAVCQNVTSCQDRYAYYWSRQYTNSTSTLPTAIHSTSPAAAWIGETMTISGNGFAGATGVSFNGTSATSFNVDSDTQITVTVPTGATSGPITVTGPAGTGASAGSFTILPPPAPPAFNSFAPASGAVGAVVTLTGSGFTGAGGVAFDGTSAAFHVDSDTQITAVVPSGAGNGPITVSNPGGSSSSTSSFTVSSPTPIGTNVARLASPTASSQNSADNQTAAKAIDGFADGCCNGDYTHEWASQGEGVGAWLNLAWTSAQRLDSVILYDRPNPNDQITSASITFSDGSHVAVGSLPNDGSPLTVTFTPRTVTSLLLTVTGVSATTGNVGLAELKAYTAPAAAPIVSSLSPTSAAAGAPVTISGYGFQGATGVSFHGTSANFTVNSDTQITATVPSGATSGTVTVTGPAGTGTSAGNFTVIPPPPPPVFNGGFVPASGAVGAVVTLTGSGFTGASSVAFDGTSAAFHVDSDTQITAVVPSGAGNGAITVSNPGGSSSSTASFTVSSPIPVGTDVALTATATASSQNSTYGQTADKAIDGFTDGCCNGDYTHEWASQGEGVGAWLNLAWTSAQRLDSVILYDRPNPNDQITSATITFSDGSSVQVGSLPNDGSPLTVTFTPRTVTSLLLTVTGVSATTGNVGLAELKAYTAPAAAPIVSSLSPTSAAAGAPVTISGYGFQGATGVSFHGTSANFTVNSDTQIAATVPSGATSGTVTVTGPAGTGTSAGNFTVIPPPPPPVFNGGFVPASGAVGAVVTLTGSGFTGASSVAFDGTSAAFHVDSDTQITAVVPSGAGNGAITVSNPGGSSSSTASFTVSSPIPVGTDVALTATATASSQNSTYGQTADKAIDGFTDGCCNGDYTHEWASQGEGVGAWLNLAWTSAQRLDSVILYDRPNPNDQITSATLTFSDGSSVQVGSLPNDGSPLTVTFTPRTVTSLLLTVTGVSATTGNVGLAEIQAYSGS